MDTLINTETETPYTDLSFTESGQERFDEVVAWLNGLPNCEETYKLRASFWQNIAYLASYGGDRFRVELARDFAEHSFSILWWAVKDGVEQVYMNGGLIFHRSAQEWSVHT